MIYQALKYIFIRIGLSFLLLLTFGFFALYFFHEVALPNTSFNDSILQWVLLFVSLFIGFIAYGLVGEQRFHNAMHSLKNISTDVKSEEVIEGFQAVLDFTYSAYFLPKKGKYLRRNVIFQFADYLLYIGSEDARAQKIYLKAFLLKPEDPAYRVPLLSIFRKDVDLTVEEIDLLLVILKAGDFSDKVIVSNLAKLFLYKNSFNKKSEPVFLAALLGGSEESKEIVDLVLPKLLSVKRSDAFALRFYIGALSMSLADVKQVHELIAISYCRSAWKEIDPDLHRKCGEVFDELNEEYRAHIIKETAGLTVFGKIEKIKLLGKDDLRELDKLKSKMGFSKSSFENLKDLFGVISKILTNFFVFFYRRVFKTQTRGFIFFLTLILAGSLSYLKWQNSKEIVADTEIKALDSAIKTASGKSASEIHTLQVAASTSSKDAHRLIANLKKNGVRNVYQVKTKRKSGETWYKIRVGRFDSKENARRFADQLINKKTIKNYFIISFPVNN
jgi:hypothetical protein